MIRKLAKSALRKRIASGFALFLLAMVLCGCGTNIEISATTTAATPAIEPGTSTATAPTTAIPISTSAVASLPLTTPPPLPITEFPILGDAYNPPDPGEPANTFLVDAYELRPNLMVVKAGTTVTWVNLDNKPLFVVSVDALFFGITSPYGLSWSYLFASPGTFAFTVSPYPATEIGVVVVTE